jgi:predicted  nucleic acid-binding Zn-ribbon protein
VSVKEILKGLHALQKVDLEILELQRAGDAHPKRLAELDQQLAGARAGVEVERGRTAENERARRDKEAEIQAEKEKVKKWESRLSDMRTTREYAALAREIDIAKKAILNLEDELKALVDQAGEFKRALADREAELRRREDGTAAERTDLTAKIGSLASQVKELSEKRAEVAKNADSAIVGRYDAIRKKRGSGVVPVVNGICKGCNMRLPPQLQNILRSGATIEACPSCQRLIYASEVFSAEALGLQPS